MSSMSYLPWASYWRNSLADAESGKGALKASECKSFLEVDRDVRQTGVLPAKLVEKLFKDVAQDTNAVKVIYRPNVIVLTLQHGKSHQGNLPEILTALACPMWVNRQGYLFPSGPAVVPRDLLHPQDNIKFTVGTVADLDVHLTTHQLKTFAKDQVPHELDEKKLTDIKKDWLAFIDHCSLLYQEVCKGLGSTDIQDFYSIANYSWIQPVDSVSGMSANILKLYDSITSIKPELALFSRYSTTANVNHKPCIDFYESVSLRLGHSSDKYCLADAQRDALSHSLAMNHGDILAVNGPPGTGKTTYLLSVVASIWVKAALEQNNPPIIVAASTNNQAVTNIIDAFGKDFSEGEGALSGRWLPDITSYGAYFPSATRLAEAQKSYQTQSFFAEIEDIDYLDRAEHYFLQHAMAYFNSDTVLALVEIKARLHTELLQCQSSLKRIESLWSELCEANALILAMIGAAPEHDLMLLKDLSHYHKQQSTNIKSALKQWQHFLANESIWLSLFSWLKPVRDKKNRLRELYITTFNDDISSLVALTSPDFEQAESDLKKAIQQHEHSYQQLLQEYQDKKQLLEKRDEVKSQWQALAYSIGLDKDSLCDLNAVDKKADTAIRFVMFRLAVHYWEACWLIENRELGDDLNKIKTKTGRTTVVPRWYRRMMITPCIVSTFHALPAHMTCSAFNNGKFDSEYLFDFIDLLVVDEGGQVSPDVAGASFSLAKKSLVIGDIHQIEPVRSISGSIDIGNLFNASLLEKRQDYEAVQANGRSVVNGSVMHIAQAASQYCYQAEMEAGMYLREHRRCFDDIISFCNELCYKGILQPKRGLALDTLFPAFGHLHIDGRAEQQLGGSRFNRLEAKTIADWLAQNKTKLESTYNKPLEDIVGIVTPFSAQVNELQKACKLHGIETGKQQGQLTVGTVHALQGAERLIVIFSPVYTRHSNGEFIDSSTSMLNVAISRAKDSFLVFGDLDVLSAASSRSPRAILAKYLFAKPENELVFKVSKRTDLLRFCVETRLINDALEHDQYLIELLKHVKESIVIVSPWVSYQKLLDTGIYSSICETVARGVKIRLFTDWHFNTTINNQFNAEKEKTFIECCEKLASEGVDVAVIRGVHSKIVMSDSHHMCVGSFNWLSASRAGVYANMETSMIYSGDLKKEINTQTTFLNARVDKIFNSNKEKISLC
ncbi:AAA domain-containing protein [Shewanella basaltis]|uniref:AAA domain-containing protein n=1 Tax=Shewanella basaltis TaxID=472183 RepID=UPI00200E76C8|nr:AAA domain-containing protein [Shewanella basaltis]MCL1114431.1 AAA domain-containing protein [Shewanella basaltis]